GIAGHARPALADAVVVAGAGGGTAGGDDPNRLAVWVGGAAARSARRALAPPGTLGPHPAQTPGIHHAGRGAAGAAGADVGAGRLRRAHQVPVDPPVR